MQLMCYFVNCFGVKILENDQQRMNSKVRFSRGHIFRFHLGNGPKLAAESR